jgi:hypothetical protein
MALIGCEACFEPRNWLAEAQIAEGSPVGRRDAGFDRHDFGDEGAVILHLK